MYFLVDFKRFSLTCKGFKDKFCDILLKVCTKIFSESSSVTGNDERRPKDGKFPTLDGGDPRQDFARRKANSRGLNCELLTGYISLINCGFCILLTASSDIFTEILRTELCYLFTEFWYILSPGR